MCRWRVVMMALLAACGGKAVIDGDNGTTSEGGSAPTGGVGAAGGTTAPVSPWDACAALVERICGCCDVRDPGYSCDVNSAYYGQWIDRCASSPPANVDQLGDTCGSLPPACSEDDELSPCDTAPCLFDAAGRCECV